MRRSAWRWVAVGIAGVLVPGLGYGLVRRPGLAGAVMALALAVGLVALRVLPSPWGVAPWPPLVGVYVVIWLGSAVHAAWLARAS